MSTTREDVVETVARAIVRERYIMFTGKPEDFRELLRDADNAEKFERSTIDFEWEKYVTCARAAIEALAANVSDEMVEAALADDVFWKKADHTWTATMRRALAAAIRAGVKP